MNTIDFSPSGFPFINFSVSVWCDRAGNRAVLRIDAGKSYFYDPHYKSLPYDQARAEIENDRETIIADSAFIEIDSDDGHRQIAPLSFIGGDAAVSEGKEFVISGKGYGPAHAPVASLMEIALDSEGGKVFDVRIPAMTVAGQRLEFPVIRFIKVH